VPLRSGRCLLRFRLKEAGITQKSLADRLLMPISQVSDYVNNRRDMTLNTAANNAYVLNCAIEDLYEWEEIPPSERKRRREQ
jgi:transcriptional regulator with XRE-family HTH domain